MSTLALTAIAPLAACGPRCAAAPAAPDVASPARDDGPVSTNGGAASTWVGTWAAPPQLTEPGNRPPSPGLSGRTLRQIVHASIGGSRLRVRLSNAYGDGPVTMKSVHVALARGDGAIDLATDVVLSFAGRPSVTIDAGSAVFSDPAPFALAPLADVAVTIAFGDVPAAITGHPGSRTTSYLATGDAAGAAHLTGATTVTHWYYASGIDVLADATAGAIVTLGDSITDGRGSTPDGNDRWPDVLSRRLQSRSGAGGLAPPVAVLNAGIGGNAVVSGGLGPTATARFGADVLYQSGARWLVLLEGVNDIGGSTDSSVAASLIAAFGAFVDQAHRAGLRAYGVPILPFGGSAYDSPLHEASRQAVNAWIRTSGRFDAVIDLDAVVRDPASPNRLLGAFDTGDHLHLNPAGYRAMGEAVDLGLFRSAG